MVEEPVSYVNAPVIAADRNVEVRLLEVEESPEYRSLVTVRGTLLAGRTHSVSGTLVGPKNQEKLVEDDGLDIEEPLTAHMAFFRYVDRPGVIGTVGRIFGDAGINIGGMQVSRDTRGGDALVGMAVDSVVPAEVLDEVLREVGAEFGRTVDVEVATR
jgi:D-3-phosphoglycerate dehydrogenase